MSVTGPPCLIMQSLRLLSPPYCDDITVAFNDVTTFSDVNLNAGVHDLLQPVHILDYYLTGKITWVG